MKIIELRAENVKRIQAVNIKPDGSLVVIGGRNGAGKSSTLDCIKYALGGKKGIPSEPVRKGEKRGEIFLDLGELKIHETIGINGASNLVVKNADGLKYPSPQKILDELMGPISFDPLEFARQKPDLQSATLQKLVGLDFRTLNQRRQEVYSDRTVQNRIVRNLESRIGAMPKATKDAPGEESSTAGILEQQKKAQAINEENMRIQTAWAQKNQVVEFTVGVIEEELGRITSLQRQIKNAQTLVEEKQASLKKDKAELEALGEQVQELQHQDLNQFDEKLKEAEKANTEIRLNIQRGKDREKLVTELTEANNSSDKLTKELEDIDVEKCTLISEAPYPIKGLAVTDEGNVVFEGLPLDQASSAEQLRVSVAIGLALNPKLKVLLIRDGSLLDDDSLAMVGEMAEGADAQVWIERVGEGDEVSVIIEDGMVKGEQQPVEEIQEQLV